MPRKTTGVSALLSLTVKRTVTPSGSRFSEPFTTMPPSRIALVRRYLAGGDIRRRNEIGRTVLQAPHGEQHRAEHCRDGQDDQDQPLMLGLDHHWRRFSASASASAPRIDQYAHAASTTVATTVTA